MMSLKKAKKIAYTINPLSFHSFFGLNICDNKITSLKIYFTFNEDVFLRIVKKVFKKNINYIPFFKKETDIGTRLPGIAIKIINKKCLLAYYYNVKNLKKDSIYEDYKLIAFEENNKRTYNYTKNKNYIKRLKKEYNIYLPVSGIEICRGKGIRSNRTVSYEKIAVITNFNYLKDISPLKFKNFNLISFGKDKNLKTTSYYYSNTKTWRLSKDEINQIFSSTIIDGKAIKA
jgi:hypothetical protein